MSIALKLLTGVIAVVVLAETGHPIMTGKGWLNVTYTQPKATTNYVVGFFDGFAIATGLARRSSAELAGFDDCLARIPANRLATEVDSYLSVHPERWNDGLWQVTKAVVMRSCDQHMNGRSSAGNWRRQ